MDEDENSVMDKVRGAPVLCACGEFCLQSLWYVGPICKRCCGQKQCLIV
jgi:hypothetical protein